MHEGLKALVRPFTTKKFRQATFWQIKTQLRRIGIEFPRMPDVGDFLISRDVDLVVDVGASIGEYGTILRHFGYDGHIVSFEPIKSLFSQLRTLAERDRAWTCYNYALGDVSGDTVINVSQQTHFSSILPQTPAALDFDARAVVERTETVQVKRLDDLAPKLSGKQVFLKVDTQGFERHVLEGARSYLKTVVGVQLELPITNLYQQSWTFIEAINYMQDAGFMLSQMMPVSHRKQDEVSIMEIDCLFRRLDAGDRAAS